MSRIRNIFLLLSALFIVGVGTASSQGTENVTQGATVVYSVNDESGWSYNWTITGTSGTDWVANAGAGLNLTYTQSVKWEKQGTYTVRIQATDDHGCLSEPIQKTINVLPPAPGSGGNQSVCYGASNPALTVTVGTGETADWYAATSGGTALLSNNTSYTSSETAAGTYTYYAEARNTATGFKSAMCYRR